MVSGNVRRLPDPSGLVFQLGRSQLLRFDRQEACRLRTDFNIARKISCIVDSISSLPPRYSATHSGRGDSYPQGHEPFPGGLAAVVPTADIREKNAPVSEVLEKLSFRGNQIIGVFLGLSFPYEIDEIVRAHLGAEVTAFQQTPGEIALFLVESDDFFLD